jgi:hypothetical protein
VYWLTMIQINHSGTSRQTFPKPRLRRRSAGVRAPAETGVITQREPSRVCTTDSRIFSFVTRVRCAGACIQKFRFRYAPAASRVRQDGAHDSTFTIGVRSPGV